jgi:hypothetical protein
LQAAAANCSLRRDRSASTSLLIRAHADKFLSDIVRRFQLRFRTDARAWRR